MINWVLRGALLLWAIFFALIGVQELFSSAPYFGLFGITGDATAINTVRADLSAFFLVSAVGALIGALRPAASKALLVPAALFGTALAGRIIGLVLGDGLTPGITQAIISEALSVALLLGAMRILSKPSASTEAGPAGIDAA